MTNDFTTMEKHQPIPAKRECDDGRAELIERFTENADYYASIAQDLERDRREHQRKRSKATEGS